MRSSEHNDEVLIGLEWTLKMKQRTAVSAMPSRPVHLTSSHRVSRFLREIKHFPEKPCEFFVRLIPRYLGDAASNVNASSFLLLFLIGCGQCRGMLGLL